jgi:protein-tyrosine-phosphatase
MKAQSASLTRARGFGSRARTFGKGLVPQRIKAVARQLLALEPSARRTYALAALRRLCRADTSLLHELPDSIYNLLFLCHGNILRSPFSATLLAQMIDGSELSNIRVNSAGLHAAPNTVADPRGVSVANEMGADLSGHRARAVSADMVARADLVVVMDFANQAVFLSRFPHARHKLRLLGAFAPDPFRNSVEIADPFTLDLDAVRRCYCDVAQCIVGLHRALTQRAVVRR